MDNKKTDKNNDQYCITHEDFLQFTNAKSYDQQIKILLAHSQKNKKKNRNKEG